MTRLQRSSDSRLRPSEHRQRCDRDIQEFVLRVTLRFVLRFAPTSFCASFSTSFCASRPDLGNARHSPS
jgi:hypothetical protein